MENISTKILVTPPAASVGEAQINKRKYTNILSEFVEEATKH